MEQQQNSKQEGLFLGGFSYEDKTNHTKKYVQKVLVWNSRTETSIAEPCIVTIFGDSDVSNGQKIFAPVEANFYLRKDFKTGYFKPIYTGLQFKNK
ncbi:MAG: hypothetical protein RSB59_06485 [Clostridia bacterium]